MTREKAHEQIECLHINDIQARGLHLVIDKIYDDFENEEQLQKPKEVCNHEETTPYYEYVRCNECGAIKTDSDSSWGIAKNKWFKNKEEAYFYKEKGYLPTCENKGTA